MDFSSSVYGDHVGVLLAGALQSAAFTYLSNCVSKLHSYVGFYPWCMWLCRRLACWRTKSAAFTYLSNSVRKLHAYVDFYLRCMWSCRRLACWRFKATAFISKHNPNMGISLCCPLSPHVKGLPLYTSLDLLNIHHFLFCGHSNLIAIYFRVYHYVY